jgi:hypothetical protein
LVRGIAMLSANHFVILVNGTAILASDLIMRTSVPPKQEGIKTNKPQTRVSNMRRYSKQKIKGMSARRTITRS